MKSARVRVDLTRVAAVWTASRWRPARIAAFGTGVLLAVAIAASGIDGADPGRSTGDPLGLEYQSDLADPAPTDPANVHLVVGPATSPATGPAAGPATGRDPARTAKPAVRQPSAAPRVPAPARKAPAAPPRIGRASFVGVAGEQCPEDGGKGYRRAGSTGGHRSGSRHHGGRTGSSQSSSYLRRTGGWTGNGCAGAFHAVPLTGQSRSSAHSLWWFRTGAVQRGSCAVAVYVPRAQARGDVTARPAYYNVLTGSGLAATRSFTVDQVANQGRWVSAGTSPVRDGTIAVQLLNRGGGRGGHAGAAQVKVTCH
jgi:translation initiation factor IF-2